MDLGNHPLANSLRGNLAEPSPEFPLCLCRCDSCGTVQLTETVSPEVLFEHYVWITGTSEGARTFSTVFCDRIIKRSPRGPLFVLEVASNDGTFLKPFLKRGHRVLGVDPAGNLATYAREAGVPTITDFFGLAAANRIVVQEGHADVVFARNVIPHVANPIDVVEGIAHCLAPSGIAAIEFHRADIILDELQYDSIYHEHLFFHSLHTIERLLEKAHLIPFDVTTSPISGGAFVVYFSKHDKPPSAAYLAALHGEEMLGVHQLGSWQEFGRRCDEHRVALRSILNRKKFEGKRIIGYGASARSSTLLNYSGIDNNLVEVIADRAPLKHGMYTAGTNIPIVPPERAFSLKPDVILLLAWNFREEILAQIRAEHGWTGELIVPLPRNPTVIDIG